MRFRSELVELAVERLLAFGETPLAEAFQEAESAVGLQPHASGD
jgi:hypothetical protein